MVFIAVVSLVRIHIERVCFRASGIFGGGGSFFLGYAVGRFDRMEAVDWIANYYG